MQTNQGIYTINGNMFCERPGQEKVLPVVTTPNMPSPTSPDDEEIKKNPFQFPQSRKGKISLAFDIGIVVAVALLIALIEFGILPHNHAGFYCNDPKISFRFQGDTVSMGLLLTSVFLVPLILIILVEIRECRKYSVVATKRLWHWYKEFLLGMTVNLLVTEFAKLIIGEPRPHFLDTCRPDTAINCTKDEYIPNYTCTNTHIRAWFVSDSSKSFPSGHASLSVFATVFCVWYVQQCFSQMSCRLLKPLLQTFLVIFCTFCSLSRITDHRHHWWDVLAGSVLGFLCAIYTVIVFCHNFRRPPMTEPRPSQSTCTLLTDPTNKHATSVVL